MYKQGETSQLASLKGMAPPVWTETGEKNNRKNNKHKSGTEPTFLKIRRVCCGARHTKHMVWLLPAWLMHIDTLILGSAATAGSEHTDESISEVIRNGSHACEDLQVLISLLKQRRYWTNRKIEGLLEGFTTMHINKRLLLANYRSVKCIPSGSARDP